MLTQLPTVRTALLPVRKDANHLLGKPLMSAGHRPRLTGTAGRALYQEEFGALVPARDAGSGRDRGDNVVGDKPGRSPRDTSGLSPDGEELVKMPDGADLLKMEREDATRAEKFRGWADDEFGDADDLVKDSVQTVEELMDQPSPTGHPGVLVDHQPHFVAELRPNGAPDVGSVAELALVLGVLGDRTVSYLRHKVAEVKGRD